MNEPDRVAGSYCRSVTGFFRRNDVDVYFIAIDRQGAGFSAEVPLKIVPLPSITEWLAAKIAFVSYHIAGDATQPALNENVRQLGKRVAILFAGFRDEIGRAASIKD